MRRKIKVSALLLIIWPVVFGFLYLNPPEFTPSISDDYVAPTCNFDPESPLINRTIGCACPQIAIREKGFPIRVTGYGHCGLGEDSRAVAIDRLVLIAGELILAFLFVIAVRKDRQSK